MGQVVFQDPVHHISGKISKKFRTTYNYRKASERKYTSIRGERTTPITPAEQIIQPGALDRRPGSLGTRPQSRRPAHHLQRMALRQRLGELRRRKRNGHLARFVLSAAVGIAPLRRPRVPDAPSRPRPLRGSHGPEGVYPDRVNALRQKTVDNGQWTMDKYALAMALALAEN